MDKNELNQTILASFNWRYGTKAFDPAKKIPEAEWHTLRESLRLAASSYGLQPWKFIEIVNPETRKKLADAAPLNRAKIETSSNLIIVSSLRTISQNYMDRHFNNLATTRGLQLKDIAGFSEMVSKSTISKSPEAQAHWAALQTYIAVGSFITTAAVLGVDACAMEGIDPAKFDEILGLRATDYRCIVGLTAGYRSPEDKTQFGKKVRFNPEDVFVKA